MLRSIRLCLLFTACVCSTAFADKNSIVLTRSVAEKFFGQEPALGKIMRLDYQYDFRVTGGAGRKTRVC